MNPSPFVPNVAIINESTVVSDQQVYALTYALQIQTQKDFAPLWGIPSKIYYLDKTKPVLAGHWMLVILDNADQANALGYHDLSSDFSPLGKVFAKTTIDAGENWTVTASHELLEMLVDPFINLTTFTQTGNNSGRIIPYEVCDAVQESTFKINGIEVSNFVLPSWFEDFRQPNSVKFDFLGILTSPYQLAKGGYMSYFDVPNTKSWQQIFADKFQTSSKVDHSAARKLLRGRPRKNWKKSIAK